MCGIVGQWNFDGSPVNIEEFNSMRDTMTHRGPDGKGTCRLNTGMVAFGHRRLSIIDLSEKGAQPMANEDETVWITFNGEVYNYASLRDDLITKGHKFKSGTDTEVMIHGYEEWGEEIVSKAEGMFAFAIWDQKKQEIFMARDRMGIKPLYYYLDNNLFVFASEIKGIIKNSNIHTTLNYDGISDYFVYRFIPSPKTVWNEINKLEPGSWAIVDLSGKMATRRYWAIDQFLGNSIVDSPEEKVHELLRNAVGSHLVSDVPVGMFLSGGYDSGAVLKYMSDFGSDIQTFSIGFKDWPKSEHHDAGKLASMFSTQHNERILEESVLGNLKKLSFHYDEPLGGSSFLPTYEVSKLASSKVKVVLSGDGGDEVFAGYSWHKAVQNDFQSKGLFGSLRDKISGKKNVIADSYWSYLSWSGIHFRDLQNIFGDEAQDKKIFSKEDSWYYKKRTNDQYDPVKAFQVLDYYSFLPEVVLTKVDRASMANSLEVRVPLLDHKLSEFVLSLSSEQYFTPGLNKVLLGKVLERSFDQDFLTKKKQGFGAPVRKGGEFQIEIDSLRESKLWKSNAFNTSYIEKEFIQTGDHKKLWPLVIFAHWMNEWT